ncbi:MAG: amino acid adenylation domain-containing protein [Bacteroidales bacterium]|nr:amino acid adenylation domain-containing protein [Bacteroidales bacterium]
MNNKIINSGLLHNIFEKQVDHTPHALAVKSDGREFTYIQIEEKANRLSRYLLSKGLKTGDFVAIYFKRSELPIIGMLGILKAGGAYVPIDRSFPEDRIKHIIADASIKYVLTESDLIPEISTSTNTDVSVLNITDEEILNHSERRLSNEEVKIYPENLTYIIYTSGSTGRPKGVMTQHFNVVHFVNSFKQVCQLNSSDRLYNGFAYSFDGSVEEIWMAFSSGASLIVATDEMAKLVSSATRLIQKEKITFLSTVPTFLSMVHDAIPTVRLIILSGEKCPPELVNKWAKNGCRMLNVYGPTETTVNTTAWDCIPGKQVSIGKPIPGYEVTILDENKKPVADGKQGELYIGGDGLAKGYLNQEKLTDDTFIKGIVNNHRLYKTGDLVSLNSVGELMFHGRIDSQVKIRGYRIELSEIEAVLREHANVNTSTVTVTEKNGLNELAAYIVLKNEKLGIEKDELINLLRRRLPSYMVPSYLEIIDEIPTLTSGKTDKKSLPEATTPLINSKREIVAPETKMEMILVRVWKDIFQHETISTADHFFNDLGGHSLLAAQAVSILRYEHFIELAIRDIYSNPSIKDLAVVLENLSTTEKKRTKETIAEHPSPSRTFSIVQILQAISMYVLYGFMIIPIIALSTFYLQLTEIEVSGKLLISSGLTLALLMYPVMLLSGIALKWIIIGKIKPGNYPVYGWYYFRWWLSDRIYHLTGAQLLAGSPLMSVYFRLMGAKVGENCTIDTHLCSAFDLISIGDNTSIGNETQIMGCTVENGYLKIGRISIGENCYVGIHSHLEINSKMENNSKLGDISVVQQGQVIKQYDSLKGSPSQKGDLNIPQGRPYQRKPIFWGMMHLFAVFALILFVFSSGIPSLFILNYGLTSASLWVNILSLLTAGPMAVLSFCLLAVIVKKLIFSKIKPGTYKTESFFFIKKWFIDSILRLSVMLVKPVYTTIYLPIWLRMLGAKMGKRAEISTVSQISPELMEIGDESFFADGSMIGGRSFHKGYMEISKTRIGNRSFVGNSAILPVGTNIGDNCLIGVLSVPPLTEGTIEDSTDWLGSPSFNLPQRQKVEGFADEVIFNPSLKLYVKRLLIDALRIFIPSTIEVIGVLSIIYSAYYLYEDFGIISMITILPIISILVAITSALMVVGVKWLLIGKIHSCIKPLWSTFVWFNEAVNGTYESVTSTVLVPMLGTPFFAPFLRLMGCKIGGNVYMGTNLFSEFDLVHIGNNTALNAGVIIQNHLFEDRIMKASSLVIKNNCNIGNMSVVLYDSVIENNASLKALSLVMKGENLPEKTSWIGIPCQSI